MSDNLIVNCCNLEDCGNSIEGFRKNFKVGLGSLYEEVTVMKTEVKEECYDFGMSGEDIVFVNVKEEYIPSSETNLETENSGLVNSTEQSLNENPDVRNYESNEAGLQENEYKREYSDYEENIHEKKHSDLKHNNTDTRYECAHCMYSTPLRSNLAKHARIHAKDKAFKCTYKNCKCMPGQDESCECDTCGYTTVEKCALQRHVLARHSTVPKKYKCADCEYATHSKTSLVIHSRIHTGDKPFKCTYKNCKCIPGEDKLCECDTCEYAAVEKVALQRHVLVKHSAESKKYKCGDCNYASHRKAYLMIHLRTHTNERPFKCTYKNCKCTPEEEIDCKCDTCGYAGREKSSLQKHIFIKHNAEIKKCKCGVCNYASHTKSALTQHLLTHTNEKPFKCTYRDCKCLPGQEESCDCDMCGYAAIQNSNLKRHILVMHSAKTKKYRCRDCKYVTHVKTNLDLHIRIHANDRPYKCTFKNCKCAPEQEDSCECNTCNYSATVKGALQRHVLAKHGAKSKKYTCIDYKYTTHVKGDITGHIRTYAAKNKSNLKNVDNT